MEVDRSGATRSHVFRGKVELRLAAGGTAAGEGPGAGRDSAWARTSRPGGAGRGPRGQRWSVRGQRRPDPFARQMPRRVPIKLFNTGVGLKEGDPDPHWQLVARSDDPHFKPRPAVVTARPAAARMAAERSRAGRNGFPRPATCPICPTA